MVGGRELPDGVLTPAEAAKKKEGEKVTVQFTVASVGGKANLYLNTEKDFRAKDNFAVVLPPKVQTGKWEKVATVPGFDLNGDNLKDRLHLAGELEAEHRAGPAGPPGNPCRTRMILLAAATVSWPSTVAWRRVSVASRSGTSGEEMAVIGRARRRVRHP